jgi:hypothetical protein
LSITTAVASATPVEPLLPVAHLTGYRFFEANMSSRALPLNSKCPRLGRPATYFFYGAPFYRLPHKATYELDIEEVDDLPVAVLIPPEQMSGIRTEIYPFDTGAWARGLYEGLLPKKDDGANLDDFVTESADAPTDAARLVELLFGTNLAYIRGTKIASRSADAGDFVHAVKTLHQAKLKADIRRRAIEVIALEPVPWPAEGLVVIGPEYQIARRRKGKPELDQLLNSRTTTVIYYADMYPFSPTSESRAVLEYAVKWLSQQGFLPDVS